MCGCPLPDNGNLIIFPGLSGFPQVVQPEETPAVQPVVEENVNFFFAPMGFP